MATELYAFVYTFDDDYMVQRIPEESLSRELSLEAFVDSRMLFNVNAKNRETAEQGLLISVFALKESYRRRGLKLIGQITGMKTQ